ncbi:MAG: helix-turn-helix domain-containing protein [Plesiomonas sp.]|uniref:helix-turn-helix domain-containing protein n=1 Tax=Plesiomonas sp. TaxID=2486279 RepID=UPI003F2A313D
MEKYESSDFASKRTNASDEIVRFSERLKIAMNGMSNHRLARLSGLSEATIRKYIKGESYPTIDNAAKVADACNVTLAWLLTGDQHNSSQEPLSPSSSQHESSQSAANSSQASSKSETMNSLKLMISSISPEDSQVLFDMLCNIGIKGILSRLQASQVSNEAPRALLDAQGTEAAIRSLDIRESLKDAVCSLIPGDEYTDREILRRFESHIRAASQDSSATNTPENNQNVGKKQA